MIFVAKMNPRIKARTAGVNPKKNAIFSQIQKLRLLNGLFFPLVSKKIINPRKTISPEYTPK